MVPLCIRILLYVKLLYKMNKNTEEVLFACSSTTDMWDCFTQKYVFLACRILEILLYSMVTVLVSVYGYGSFQCIASSQYTQSLE